MAYTKCKPHKAMVQYIYLQMVQPTRTSLDMILSLLSEGGTGQEADSKGREKSAKSECQMLILLFDFWAHKQTKILPCR